MTTPSKPRRRPAVLPAGLAQRAAAEQSEQPRTLAETDSRYHSIGLPSRFQWYSFKQLSIRPLGVPEVKKIFSSHVANSVRGFYEALAPCIDQNIMDLTIGDVYAVMFWLRLNSYPRTPYTMRFRCNNKDHIHKVLTKPGKKDKWKQLPLESLDNTHELMGSDIREVPMKDLEELGAAMLATEMAKRGVAFYPATVRDLVEIEEYSTEDWFDAGDDHIFRMASYLDRRHGVTLKERYDFILNNPQLFQPDDIIDLDRIIELCTHGVQETVTLPCKECGASNTVEAPIDARTFLPHL